jgi:AraC family transcriptional regulator of arabinose operon
MQRKLLRALAFVCENVVGWPDREPTQIDPRIQRVLAFIDADPAAQTDRRSLARIAGLSPSRFHELFLQTVGSTPIDFLISRRLDLAIHLLSATDKPIAIVAEASGFASAYYFSRLFRSRMGVPPSAFRDRQSCRDGGRPSPH